MWNFLKFLIRNARTRRGLTDERERERECRERIKQMFWGVTRTGCAKERPSSLHVRMWAPPSIPSLSLSPPLLIPSLSLSPHETTALWLKPKPKPKPKKKRKKRKTSLSLFKIFPPHFQSLIFFHVWNLKYIEERQERERGKGKKKEKRISGGKYYCSF